MAEPTPEPKSRVSPAVKLFVAFHLVCITVWALPNPKRPYMNETIKLAIK